MKGFMSLLLAGVMAMSLAACGSNGSTTTTEGGSAGGGSPSTTGSGGTREIKWMSTRSAWPIMHAIAADYSAQTPDANVEFDIISDSSYYQKLRVLAASSELPDLFDCEGDTWAAEIAQTGILADVDALYDELGYDRMMNIGLNYARLDDGKLYHLAWENNIEYFWYNKELFAQAGVAKAPDTFDELLVVCQQLVDAGIAPVATWEGWSALRWLSFIPFRLTGNDYIESLKVGEAKMSDPVGLQAAEFFQTMGMNYFQPGWATNNYTDALEAFLGGNAAIYYIGTWQFGSFLDEDRELLEKYDYFLLPTLDGAVNDATAMVSHAGTGTAIRKDKLDDTLKDFIAYVLDVYPERAFYEDSTVPPMTFDTTLGTFSSFDQKVLDDCENLSEAAYTWDVRMDTETVETIYVEIANLGLGAITPEEFAQRIDDAIAVNAPKYFG